MKVSNIIIAVTAVAVGFTSCSKNKENVIVPDPVTPVSDIIAVMKFNGNVEDSAGKISLNGSWGSTSYVNDRKGNPNGAIVFNGTNKLEFFNVPSKGQSMTLAAWIKIQGPSLGAQNFVSLTHPNFGGITLRQSDLALGTSVSLPSTASTFSDPVANGWHHLVVTYDGVDMKVYVDGILTSSKNHPGTIGNDNRTLLIGGWANYFWQGTIDELRIYNSVKSAKDIQELAAL